jgi:lambda repressor-like predicted transcriptional regulator
MPRKGPAYPITEDWQDWVRARIKELKKAGEARSQNEIAEMAGIAKSSLSEALSKSAVQTTVMPEIHKALGWPPPLLCPPLYILALVQLFEQLDERTQGEWLERLRQDVEKAKRRQS